MIRNRKESQCQDNIMARRHVVLNENTIAYFTLPKTEYECSANEASARICLGYAAYPRGLDTPAYKGNGVGTPCAK